MEEDVKECVALPYFTTVSPTCQRGGKPQAWRRFRLGKYIAIGWCYDNNLAGMTWEEIRPIVIRTSVPSENASDERDGLHSFPIFLELCRRGSEGRGDYVAVKNVNHGLFGIGIIKSGYQYDRHHHFTGELGHYYPHFVEVEWVCTDYIRSREIDFGSETHWMPFGTLGQLYTELPSYILPYIGRHPSR
jgi:hypothetical protein